MLFKEMNSIFGRFMESWILRVSCKVNVKPFGLQKIEFIAYIYILYYQSSINFEFSPNLAGFPDILN